MRQILKSLHQTLRRWLPGYYRAYTSLLGAAWSLRALRRLERRDALRYLWLKAGGGKRGSCHALRLRGVTDPVWVRARSSDVSVFEQIFLKEEYSNVLLQKPHWIMDAGANIGLAAVYFLVRYPQSCVLAVEPSPANFAMLQKNLAPYSNRCALVHGAVWTEACKLSLRFDDVPQAEWAVQVQADTSGDIQASDMTGLLEGHGISRLSLLKMDVEGAEEAIFSATTDWLSRVEVLAIELHGEAATHAVEARCSDCFKESRQDREIRIYTGNYKLSAHEQTTLK